MVGAVDIAGSGVSVSEDGFLLIIREEGTPHYCTTLVGCGERGRIVKVLAI